MSEEWVQKVDRKNHIIGMMGRHDAHLTGQIYRATHAFILHSDKKVLIQKRSQSKPTWPGFLDLSLAEALKVEESYEQALRRGLVEELGIPSIEGRLISQEYYQEYRYQELKVNVFVNLYVVQYSGEVRFPDGEVQSAEWMTKQQVDQLLESKSALCTPWLIADWKTFCVKEKL